MVGSACIFLFEWCRSSAAHISILDNNGLHHIPIELVPGRLSDHYDPMAKTVRLSEDIYYGRSIASVSVAAHEVGHAIQHDKSYGFLALRHRMFPLLN